MLYFYVNIWHVTILVAKGHEFQVRACNNSPSQIQTIYSTVQVSIQVKILKYSETNYNLFWGKF